MRLYPMIMIIICSLLVVSLPVLPQRLESNVTLTLELLPLEKQEKLKNFAEVIERYINEFDWTGEEFDEPLLITINLQLQESSSSFEDRYSGIFMISNNSDMQYYDKYWRFPYTPEMALEHGGIYQPFTGFIDFYVYIILAGEYDKLGLKLGTMYYEKARQIAEQAAFDAQFSTGWKERSDLIAMFMGDENETFRKMKDRYYLGLSYLEDDDDMAKKYCLEAIDLLDSVFSEDPENKDTINFVKAHHLEIIELFKGNIPVLNKMIRLDPDRKETYQKYMY
jgi:hypothetical protein